MSDVPRFLHDGPALCAETDPELFFPEKGNASRTPKDLCGRCDLRSACLDYALSTGVDGIWGGTSPRERRELAKAQGRTYSWTITPDVGFPVTDEALRRREQRAAQAGAA